MRRTKKDRRTYSAGERGRNRVRVFPDHGTGIMRIEWREGGRRLSKSLEHRDFEKAKAQADEFAAAYVAPKPTTEPEPLTLGRLFEMYLREVTPTKSLGVQKFDRACVQRLSKVLGPNAQPVTLTRREWDMFVGERRAGRLFSGAVRSRAIARDLKLLLAILNWATRASDGSGSVLLDRNPLRGLPVPVEKNPKRPVLAADEYSRLLAVSDRVSLTLRGLLVLVYETGHRVGAVRQLRWSDVDLDSGVVKWRAESDKCGEEHSTPLTDEAVAALEGLRRTRPGIGESWVFPAPGDDSEPISRHLARDWWKRAEALAGLPSTTGRGWHSLRRRFATDHMDKPLKVLVQLGGWKRSETVLECYQHPDQDQLRQALADRRRVASAAE